MDRVVKKEDEFDQSKTMLLEDYVVENNNNVNHSNNKSISIAERRAAKCGFNASNINDSPFRTTGLPAASQPIRSPYFFTVPPGLSPSALLDSPIMLPNSQAQLSPTTGTFQFPHLNHDNLKLNLKLATNGDNSVDTECSSTFNPQGFPHSISENLRVENEPFEEFKFPSEFQEMAKKDCYADASLPLSSEGLENKSLPDQSESLCFQASNNIAANQTFNHNNHSTIKERTTHQNPEKRQKAPSIPKDVAKYSEDGYYWRKYGQKQVKGSEYPRSYFKCTNTNCLVKKKVERSHDGQITEIVYKGSHNHPKSQPNMSKGGGSCVKVEGGNKDVAFGPDWRSNGVDGTSSTPFMNDFSDPSGKEFDQPLHQEAQELSSTFGSQDGEDQNGASPDSISFNDDEEENGECEPKRRKRDVPNEATISRSTREPRVVVQIESTIDILDDGYRWRKYGQKVVKGNPNPRSYYKCTTPGCPVRKHVERAANDIKSVVTTYEGKHNHEVPSSKNGTLVISDVANLPPAVTNNSLSTPQKPDIPRSGKQAQDQLPLYMERKPPILNYNLPGNFASDLTFGTSSIYPLSFPPFPSIPYNPLLLNGNHHMKTFPSSNLYPMLPDYMSLQSTMSQVPGTGNVPLGGNYQMNNYQAFQPSIPGQETKTLRPKEEQRDDGDLYSSCLSIQNHGNGAM